MGAFLLLIQDNPRNMKGSTPSMPGAHGRPEPQPESVPGPTTDALSAAAR